MLVKPCELCGQPIQSNSVRAKYCYACNSIPDMVYNHKLRASKKFGLSEHFTAPEWVNLCLRYGCICLACKEKLVIYLLPPDHIVPLTKGGTNTIDNIQPLCTKCNIGKNNRTFNWRVRVDDLYSLRPAK